MSLSSVSLQFTQHEPHPWCIPTRPTCRRRHIAVPAQTSARVVRTPQRRTSPWTLSAVSCISSLGKVRHTGPVSSPDPLSSGPGGLLASLAPRRCPTAAPYQASVSPPVQQAPRLCPSDESCLRATRRAQCLCVSGSPPPPRQLFLTIALSHAVLPPRRGKAPDRPRSQNAHPIQSGRPTQTWAGHPQEGFVFCSP